jgi:hypothetical protein
MTHLTHAELLDAVESPAQHARHLGECAACREEVGALRAVLARAAEDRLPEPSPLFWDHFSARVSQAVRSETSSPESAAWIARLRRPLTTWALAGIACVLVIMTVVWRATLHAPSSVPRPTAPTVASTAPAGDVGRGFSPGSGVGSPVDNPDTDARWAVVRVAAEDLAWEDVRDAGIAATPGAAEGVALELTADERSELARLLNREMKRNGA